MDLACCPTVEWMRSLSPVADVGGHAKWAWSLQAEVVHCTDCSWQSDATSCQQAASQLVSHCLGQHVNGFKRPDDFSLHIAQQVLGRVAPWEPNSSNVQAVATWLKRLRTRG